MIVLHVINSVGLSGGAEQQLEANISGFNKDDRHYVAYLYEFNEISRRSQISLGAVTTHVNEGRRRRASTWSNIRGLLRIVSTVKPDIIHCTLADASLASRIAGRLTGTPVLESLVNISHERIRSVDNPAVKPWKLAGHRLVDRVTMRWVSHFHALTPTVRDSWVRTVGLDPDRITVIPRGIDLGQVEESRLTSDEKRRLRSTLGFAENPLLLMVGRQEAQKGHPLALQAMVQLRATVPEARLVLAGRQGNRSESIRGAIHRLGLDDVVIDLGPREDIHQLMEIADVFVFPSLFEGLGVSLVEAMAHGLPVVVLDRPPMNDIISPNRGVIAAADGSDLGAVLAAVLEDRDWARDLGRRAQETVAATYQLSSSVAQMQALYHSVLNGRP